MREEKIEILIFLVHININPSVGLELLKELENLFLIFYIKLAK